MITKKYYAAYGKYKLIKFFKKPGHNINAHVDPATQKSELMRKRQENGLLNNKR